MSPLTDIIRTQLTRRFIARTRTARVRGREVALAGLTSEEAYRLGRTEGFWEGASTLLRSGLVQLLEPVPVLPQAMRDLVERSH